MYAALAVMLAAAFGFSLGGWLARGDMMDLVQDHRAERAIDIEEHRREIAYLRERLVESKMIIARQSDQLARAGLSSSQAAAKASDVAAKAIEQSTSENKIPVTPQ